MGFFAGNPNGQGFQIADMEPLFCPEPKERTLVEGRCARPDFLRAIHDRPDIAIRICQTLSRRVRERSNTLRVARQSDASPAARRPFPGATPARSQLP